MAHSYRATKNPWAGLFPTETSVAWVFPRFAGPLKPLKPRPPVHWRAIIRQSRALSQCPNQVNIRVFTSH